MCRTTRLTLLAAASLAACHGYTPLPVDLRAHLAEFAQRRPTVHDATAGTGRDDALRRSDGRLVARMFHPDARLARLRAGVATAVRDEAGRWVDPQLGGSVFRILATVPDEWVSSAQLGFTLPLNGRLGKERALADRRRSEALVAAWAAEQRVANELDRAWVRCTAARTRVALLAMLCDRLRQLEGIALLLVDAGALTRPGARLFVLERQQREAALALAEAELRAAELTVRARLGLHPDAPLALAPDLDVAPFVADPTARRTAVLHGPRRFALELAHASAEAELDLEVRQQWPDLSLSPGWQSEDGDDRAGLGFNLSLPIFNANAQAIARARAERDVTAAALRAGGEQLLQELAIAEVRRAAGIAQAERLEALVELAVAQVEDGRRLADAGQFDPLLLLDALVRENDVRMDALAAREHAALTAIDINDLLADPTSPPPVEAPTPPPSGAPDAPPEHPPEDSR